jgi:uncharacterized membrane protein required for colicin V production
VNWLDYALIVILGIGVLTGLRIGILGAIYYTIVMFIGWLLAGQLGSQVGEFFKSFIDDDRIVTVASFAVIIAVVFYIGKILWPIIRTMLGIATLGTSVMVDRLGGLAIGLLLGIALLGASIVVLARLTYTFDTEDVTSLIPEQLSGYQDKIDAVMTTLTNTVAASDRLSVLLEKGAELKDSAGQELSGIDLQAQLATIEELKKSIDSNLSETEKAGQLANLDDIQKTLESGGSELQAKVKNVQADLETAMIESTIVPIFVKVTGALPGDALGFIPADFQTSMDILREKID